MNAVTLPNLGHTAGSRSAGCQPAPPGPLLPGSVKPAEFLPCFKQKQARGRLSTHWCHVPLAYTCPSSPGPVTDQEKVEQILFVISDAFMQ